MWIATTKGFFSVVDDPRPDMKGKGWLMIRARLREDLGRAFGPLIRTHGEKIYRSPNRDYAYRTFLPREAFAAEIARLITGIQYDNFKNQIRDVRLAEMLDEIWYAGARAQRSQEEEHADVRLWNAEDRDIKSDKFS
jgi:hypothetical protein